ncbi:hypothetical protein NDU88_001283 [Pleurodeles waltl]|uniref:Uncharacterized protein n=1 Tax=Pleurodeles waltl TaxID=8319 RepID=A0AAV7PC37_PLEWA|nr:hypothetical protein NDU88_001283 [Pleurodeles waltl]
MVTSERSEILDRNSGSALLRGEASRCEGIDATAKTGLLLRMEGSQRLETGMHIAELTPANQQKMQDFSQLIGEALTWLFIVLFMGYA